MSRKDTQTDKHKNRWTTCVTWLWTKWTPSRNVICSMDKQQLGRHTLSQEKPDGLASQTTAGQTNTVQKKARWTYISNNSWADIRCPKKSQMDLHLWGPGPSAPAVSSSTSMTSYCSTPLCVGPSENEHTFTFNINRQYWHPFRDCLLLNITLYGALC